ncbi:hypothetical protein M440DRAFT_225817 [Trichoderma longibrachiatum ATCC 18648]|uniref:Uncharacterized protein n=1 Tax=Trichoderma longibrachiatum ATCC 18648 TaxID=983965 RepID=A0A2T4CBT0_TRILO|nr:hypothetical protein M440DRAFT_225817 [Trichoderma longibrachiatum ATCC 18648]
MCNRYRTSFSVIDRGAAFEANRQVASHNLLSNLLGSLPLLPFSTAVTSPHTTKLSREPQPPSSPDGAQSIPSSDSPMEEISARRQCLRLGPRFSESSRTTSPSFTFISHTHNFMKPRSQIALVQSCVWWHQFGCHRWFSSVSKKPRGWKTAETAARSSQRMHWTASREKPSRRVGCLV